MSIRQKMVEKDSQVVSVRQQCELLSINRSGLYYDKQAEYSKEDLAILNRMDEIYTENTCYGYRRIYHQLAREGACVGRDRVLKYMRILGLTAIYPKKKTPVKNQKEVVYPYLVDKKAINKPNQVWSGDITYIRLLGGFCYLVAIIDWHSRYIINWCISNSLDDYYCVTTLEEALNCYQKPKIFNSDQGAQYTGHDHIRVLEENDIKISMDSVGRWADNIVIERFFRTLKVEHVYHHEYDSPQSARKSCLSFIDYYNTTRLHSALGYRTPKEVYFNDN